MNNAQKVMASIASAVVPVAAAYWTIGTILMTIGLLYIANEVAKPVVKGFAYLYGAKLE